MDRELAPVADATPPAACRTLVQALRNHTFRSFRHRNYRLYFLGQIVSFTGSWMQSTALMWLLFHVTGDLRWPSWLLVAQVAPTLLLGAWGGAMADRFDRPRLLVATQFAFLVNAVVLTLLVAGNVADPWLILMLQVMSGAVQAIDLPTRLALVPDLVPKPDLVNAVGLNSLLFNSARAVGPAVAAVLFALVDAFSPLLPADVDRVRLGAAVCFGLNSVSFIAVIAALRAIRVPRESHDNGRDAAGSMWDGIRYLTSHPTLGGLVLLTLGMCVLGWPVLTLMPAYTREALGRAEQSYNALVSGLGAGALVAALLAATFGRSDLRKRFLVLGAFATGIGLLGLSFAQALPVAVVCTAGTGFGLILYLATGQSIMQLNVPDDRRGRVMALWAMTLSASAPMGHLVAGQVAMQVGVVAVLRGMAAGVLLASAGLAALVLRRRFQAKAKP